MVFLPLCQDAQKSFRMPTGTLIFVENHVGFLWLSRDVVIIVKMSSFLCVHISYIYIERGRERCIYIHIGQIVKVNCLHF